LAITEEAGPEKATTEIAELSRERSPIYTRAELECEFRQSEIVTNVAQYIYHPETNRVEEIYRQYVVVIMQDCDLLWDYKSTLNGGPE
jgi:hypothetical protein